MFLSQNVIQVVTARGTPSEKRPPGRETPFIPRTFEAVPRSTRRRTKSLEAVYVFTDLDSTTRGHYPQKLIKKDQGGVCSLTIQRRTKRLAEIYGACAIETFI